MNVIRAKILGYCMGVRNAVSVAERAVNEEKGTVYTLGPLIHNASVLSLLEKKGLHILNGNEDFSLLQKPCSVIIRAHGTTPQITNNLKDSGATVIDATCPRVHLSQKRALEWSEQGYSVIIAGDKDHGEVTSISGFVCGGEKNVFVVQNISEAESLNVPEKSILIAQTTFSPKDFFTIQDILLRKNPTLKVFNSICSATMERQNALKDFKGMVDGILVVGGRNSANTRRLYESARTIAPSALIENEKEIPNEFFSMQNVGLTAGASTPSFIIDAVESELLKHN